MENPRIDESYKSLRRKYLFVYLLATFADWLQGPYLYRLYASYGYTRNEISLLYVTGFASGTLSGLIIGHYADTFGRKRLCIVYSLTTTATCLATSISRNYLVLTIARIFGGASTCILFSTFESWYVGQHLSRYKLEIELIADVLTRSTLYNGSLAIFAGFFSSLLADTLEYGPTAPFILAIIVSLLSGYFCSKLWHENLSVSREDMGILSNITRSLNLLLFSNKNWLLLLLGASQSIYETVLYIFVFLWSPVLEPMKISQGLVFGIFMLCIMIGSSLSSLLATNFIVKREYLLCASIALGAFGIFGATLGVYFQEFEDERKVGSWMCLLSFFVFEISVGIYYPSVGYIRGIIVPESHRTSVANWFRLPMNLFICFGLLYITIEIPKNFVVFAACSVALACAFVASLKFVKLFSPNSDYRPLAKSSQTFVL